MSATVPDEFPGVHAAPQLRPLLRWLRGSMTRRMFARAIGGGDKPNDTYLRMATSMLNLVATEIEAEKEERAGLWPSGGDTPDAHEPNEHHHYSIECEVCGQRGMLNLSIEPQRFLHQQPEDGSTDIPDWPDYAPRRKGKHIHRQYSDDKQYSDD